MFRARRRGGEIDLHLYSKRSSEPKGVKLRTPALATGCTSWAGDHSCDGLLGKLLDEMDRRGDEDDAKKSEDYPHRSAPDGQRSCHGRAVSVRSPIDESVWAPAECGCFRC